MKKSLEELMPLIDKAYEKSVAIRHEIHQHPELSGEEKETQQRITKFLREIGVTYNDSIDGYGVSALIRGRDPENAIGIRADIDALPIEEKTNLPFRSVNQGVMHACGHDVHTAILLGAAYVLQQIREDLDKSVRLIFEPREETTGGAKSMIEAGVLTAPKVDKIIGLHVAPEYPTGVVEFVPGTANAASTEFEVTVYGKSSHGASPHKGIDTIPCACQMVSALQSIITRRVSPVDQALITVGMFNSGSKNNIISNKTVFSGIIRVMQLDNRAFIKNEMEKVCSSIAAAFGCDCDVEFRDSYPTLENDPELFEQVKRAISEAIGKEKVILNEKASLGTDDFAYFCHAAKGCYFNLGSHSPDRVEEEMLHNEHVQPDDRCIKTGIIAEVCAVLNIM